MRAMLSIVAATVIALPATAPQAAKAFPSQEIAIVVGAAWNHSESASFAGVEYEYRHSARWGFGGYYETTWRGFDRDLSRRFTRVSPSGG